jgi:hypothetical protein
MGTPGMNLGSGIDITVRDGIATTISPKLKAIALDAENAEKQLTGLQGALAKITAGNLTSVSTAASGMSRSVGNSAAAIGRLSDAAAKAEGNLQRFVLQMQVVIMSANQMTAAINATGSATVASTKGINGLTAAANATGRGAQNTTVHMYEASAAIRTFGGSIPIRAAERFLTIIPGMSAALSTAFPVFGALALINVLGEMAIKVADLVRDWGALRKIQDAAFKALSDSEQKEIEIQQNMLRNTREQRVTAAEAIGSHAGQAQRGRAAGSAFDVGQDTEALRQASADYEAARTRLSDAINKSKQPGTIFNDQSEVYKRLITQYGQEEATAATGVRAAQQQLDLDKATGALATQNEKYAEGKAAMEAYKTAQEKIIAGWRDQAAEIAAFSDDGRRDVVSFWTMIGIQAQQGSISQKKAFEEMITSEKAYVSEVQRDTKERMAAFESEGARMIGEDSKQQGEESLAALRQQIQGLTDLATAARDYTAIQRQVTEQNAIAQAQTDLATGVISGQTARQEEYNAKMTAYNEILADIAESQAKIQSQKFLDPNEQKAQLTNLDSQRVQVQAQQNQLTGQFGANNPSTVGGAARNALRQAFPKSDFVEVQRDFTSLFKTIGDGFADSIAHSIVYATSFKQAMTNVAREGLQEIISALIKMAIQAIITRAALSFLLPVGGGGAGAVGGAGFMGFGFATGGIVPHYASGGPVSGTGSGTSDSMVIRASSGEYVVNARATQQHYALLNAINSGASVARAATQSTGGGGGRLHVTVEDHTLGGTTFQVNHMDDSTVRVIARQEIQNNTDGHIATAVANPNSKTSKALAVHTAATRRRNG